MSTPATRTRIGRAALIALPLYWLVLAIATHYPRVRIPGELPNRDKLVHFVAFGLLAFFYWQFMRARRGALGDRFVWISAALLIAYAAVDEYLQQFVGRDTDVLDFVADVAGIVLALTGLEVRRRSTSR